MRSIKFIFAFFIMGAVLLSCVDTGGAGAAVEAKEAAVEAKEAVVLITCNQDTTYITFPGTEIINESSMGTNEFIIIEDIVNAIIIDNDSIVDETTAKSLLMGLDSIPTSIIEFTFCNGKILLKGHPKSAGGDNIESNYEYLGTLTTVESKIVFSRREINVDKKNAPAGDLDFAKTFDDSNDKRYFIYLNNEGKLYYSPTLNINNVTT